MDCPVLKDKNVVVMGLGRFGGGADSVRFAAKCARSVTVTDSASADDLAESINCLGDVPNLIFHLEGHKVEDFTNADVVIANPAVASENKFLATAEKAGVHITTQMNLFLRYCPALTIGITGANGKSTTTALTAHILESYFTKTQPDKKIVLGGNIGNKPLLTKLEEITENDIVVLEISSFQAEQLAQIAKSCDIALLTNITPNHLDRHKTLENYIAAKENLFAYQKPRGNFRPVSLFNADDATSCQLYEKYKTDESRTCRLFSKSDVDSELRNAFKLPGDANLENLAGATAITSCLQVPCECTAASLVSFKTLAHRLELVAESDGVRWYNDSIATTPQSTIVALNAFKEAKILIAGGYDKGIDFAELGAEIAKKTKAVILIGKTAKKIADAVATQRDNETRIVFAETLKDAVGKCRDIAIAGDIVLLSPACASYDMFTNFQQRGEQFTLLAGKGL
jgi:UDP-N-acetylmuramoylalanine--D-glutamate ligase